MGKTAEKTDGDVVAKTQEEFMEFLNEHGNVCWGVRPWELVAVQGVGYAISYFFAEA